MEKIELKVRKTVKGDKWVHILERDGKVLYKSAPTHKKYVAILFNSEFQPVCRWGSIQRVGSGDFMYQYEAHVFPYLAVSDEPGVSNLIHIPAKKGV